MTLRCLLFGHRRSRSRATIDEKNGRWLSECKRCHMQLAREGDGKWLAVPPPPGRLVPIDREPNGSDAAAGSARETPLLTTPAADPTNGDRSSAAQRQEQTVELTTS